MADAQLLAGNLMVMIFPASLVGLVAADAVGSFHRRPAGAISGCFIIPSLILGTAACLPATMRMTRTTMLEVLRLDYIRTAWSKGLEGAGGRS